MVRIHLPCGEFFIANSGVKVTRIHPFSGVFFTSFQASGKGLFLAASGEISQQPVPHIATILRRYRNIFSLRSPVLAVWGRADTIQIPAFCGTFGWHPRRNERHSHPSDAPGGYSRIFHLRTASKTVVKQKKKLNYSKIINHPKDVFPLKWIGEIQEI